MGSVPFNNSIERNTGKFVVYGCSDELWFNVIRSDLLYGCFQCR